MRDEWAERFAERARAYWSPARTEDLVRDKTLAVLPAEAPELLRALGLLHRDASMPGAERRKFFQINHMVAMLGPAMRELVATRDAKASTEPLRIVDAGCGRSYLTLLLAHAIPRLHGVPVQVLGVDRNAEVIDESRRRTNAALLGDHVKHHVARLDALDVRRAFRDTFALADEPHVDAVVALHACDTATDDAIVLGVGLEATLLALAPCCQAELARKWRDLTTLAPVTEEAPSDAFAPIRRTPHLCREVGALVTDTMRQLLIRAAGYECWALELVPTEHSPKNLMLRAMNRHAPDDAARREYEALRAATGGVGIGLEERLR
ncbi:MAG: SAM-dependent methyltransferase [Sandaracinus sp.]|nr:SAM-dependent methyltransferase [Sandaracinus sp.]MCB9615739.1 SAM-dependent methyltransferase [Sandaracinus sp.]MCB9624011.1 SAM-dependent methyltransferase [Sandaracinus sp.]